MILTTFSAALLSSITLLAIVLAYIVLLIAITCIVIEVVEKMLHADSKIVSAFYASILFAMVWITLALAIFLL